MLVSLKSMCLLDVCIVLLVQLVFLVLLVLLVQCVSPLSHCSSDQVGHLVACLLLYLRVCGGVMLQWGLCKKVKNDGKIGNISESHKYVSTRCLHPPTCPTCPTCLSCPTCPTCAMCIPIVPLQQ